MKRNPIFRYSEGPGNIFRSVFIWMLVSVILALAPGDVFGATPIYVRTDGDDVICSGEVDAAVGGYVGTGQPCAALTITQALTLVDAGGTINVAAGTYAEDVTANIEVYLSGAKNGVDARTREAGNPAEESIINGMVRLNTAGSTVDGFTIDPACGALFSYVGCSVVNNVVENAHTGMFLRSPDADATLLQYNLFRNITNQGCGGAAGDAIYADGSKLNVTIEDNKFADIGYAAIILSGGGPNDNISFSNNSIYRTQQQAVNVYTSNTNLTISGNYIEQANITEAVDKGGIRLYGVDGPVTITGNTIVNSYNGICVEDSSDMSSSLVTIAYNNLTGNSNRGIFHVTTGALVANNNWYGDPTGPNSTANPGGLGDAVDDLITVSSWCTNSTCSSSISALASTSHPNTSSWYNDADPDWSWTVDDGSNTGSAMPFTTYYIADQVSSHAATDGTWLSTTSASFNSYSAAGLADGDWYFHVLIENGAGRSTAVETTGPAKIDTTVPAAGSVSDGTGADVDYTVTADTLSAGWTGFSDAGSGISKYWYAIGTASDGSDTGTSGGWVDNGAGTSVTAAGLTLTAGQVYYFAVKAEDAGGLQSAAAVSDGQVAGAAGTCGDADGDGSVMSSDVLMVKRAIDGALSLDAQQVARADVQVAGSSPDGAVDATDLDIIARTAIGENGFTPAGLTCNANP